MLIKELYCPAKSPSVRVRRFMLNLKLKIGTMGYRWRDHEKFLGSGYLTHALGLRPS